MKSIVPSVIKCLFSDMVIAIACRLCFLFWATVFSLEQNDSELRGIFYTVSAVMRTVYSRFSDVVS